MKGIFPASCRLLGYVLLLLSVFVPLLMYMFGQVNDGNGLVEIYGEKTQERGFFCMKLLAFLNTEAEPGTEAYAELWEQRFNEAKLGACAYRDKCPIYARTAKKGIQQNLFAQL